jgi:hypothetical protein
MAERIAAYSSIVSAIFKARADVKDGTAGFRMDDAERIEVPLLLPKSQITILSNIPSEKPTLRYFVHTLKIALIPCACALRNS